MITVIGGTFSRLHKGHKLMIRAAFDTGNRVILGLTTDEYLKHNKAYRGFSYYRRKKALSRYMSGLGENYEILPLDTRSGNTATRKDYSAIVVSAETYGSAVAINKKRKENGLEPLKIVSVPIVLAEDLFPLSSTRIIEGEVRPSGSRITPVRIGVATGNSLKLRAVEDFTGKVMKNFIVDQVTGYELHTDQPFGEDTVRLATKRAMEALSDRDYGIGIESGVWRDAISGKYIEKHWCVVVDRYSRITSGTSSGFELPENIIDLMKFGKNESEAFFDIYGKEDVGSHGGVINELSNGILKRHDLIVESVRNAFIPRLGAQFFGLDRKR